MSGRRLLAAFLLLAIPCALLVVRAALGDVWHTAALVPLVVSFSALGGLLAARDPRSAVGWALFVMGAGIALEETGLTYAAAGLPGGIWVAWLVSWLWIAGLGGLLVVLPLTFPDGRIPGRPARWVLAAGVLGTALVAVANAVLSSKLAATESLVLANPWGVRGADTAAAVVSGAGAVLFALAVAAAAVTAVRRYRRAAGVERAQLRWFAAAAVLLVGALVGMAWLFESGHERAAQLVMVAAAPVSPIAITVATFRYRLYAIDRIVSRAVSYTAITVLVVSVYLAAVLVLTPALADVTGGSQLAVAAATLAAAAAFQPGRHRIQAAVDRRFNRARYDAAATVAAFRQQLHADADLGAITRGLMATTATAVQPAAVRLWLASPPPQRACSAGESHTARGRAR